MNKKSATAWAIALTAIGSLMAALDTLVVSTALSTIQGFEQTILKRVACSQLSGLPARAPRRGVSGSRGREAPSGISPNK